MKKRIKLVVAYDGTNYCGWQIQPNGETIEGVLNRELSSLLGEISKLREQVVRILECILWEM